MTDTITSQRKVCRALACRRRIPDNDLFCSTHRTMIAGSRYEAPIALNREPTNVMNSEAVSRINTGVTDAVAYIAAIEGRKGAHRQARRAAASSRGAATGSGNGDVTGSGPRNPKLDEPI